eukprot:1232421-Prymnesium_polylepis.1
MALGRIAKLRSSDLVSTKGPTLPFLVFCLLCVYLVRVDVLHLSSATSATSDVSRVHVLPSEHRVPCCQLSACMQPPVRCCVCVSSDV